MLRSLLVGRRRSIRPGRWQDDIKTCLCPFATWGGLACNAIGPAPFPAEGSIHPFGPPHPRRERGAAESTARDLVWVALPSAPHGCFIGLCPPSSPPVRFVAKQPHADRFTADSEPRTGRRAGRAECRTDRDGGARNAPPARTARCLRTGFRDPAGPSNSSGGGWLARGNAFV